MGDFDIEAAPDGTVTFACTEFVFQHFDEIHRVRSWSRSLEGPLGAVELVDSSRRYLASVALADNAAG